MLQTAVIASPAVMDSDRNEQRVNDKDENKEYESDMYYGESNLYRGSPVRGRGRGRGRGQGRGRGRGRGRGH